ncbi:hypothetical protein FHX42_004433 [Saccharopolyspora lacisalsi]|uniref:Twitching motility protein PilT n=1 Tax=Halosaccharopolyspora lacisalsi TaxID=1000566 RepID=A0A839E2E2_9PSEU|nr:Mut7-C RNAse domain-containing protein [Halosaccharopolyspora lacisalsi]MBA8827049.1 hypothetical protein [Halosaccharopolyspora lacisalsi]
MTARNQDTVVLVRLAGELRFFAAPRHRREQVRLHHDGTASLGHVVQSLGVPLTEVGALVVDGVAVAPSHRPRPGAVVDVRPLERPQDSPRRFVLDVHLGALARRLRLVGVDAAYRNDAHDDELIVQAARQYRVLLTRDRGLLRRRALWSGAYVRGQRPLDQLTDVIDRFALELRPWSRCPMCNGPLHGVTKDEVVDELEPGTRRCYDAFARCGCCGRVYWRGAHARKLESTIEAARRARSG